MSVTEVETIVEKPKSAKDLLREQLNLAKLRGLVPKECFEKSLTKSLTYMALDFGLLAIGVAAFPRFIDGNYGLTALWWLYMGTMMWALFIIGHDCGHGTFSDYSWINAICGHLCHSVICVPFWPWAKSHHQHHMYHNHIEKDMSYSWLTRDYWLNNIPFVTRLFMQSPFHPFISFLGSYLLVGIPDGSHFNPFGKLFWSNTERVQCAVSTASVLAFLYFVVEVWFQRDWFAIFVQYAVPVMVFSYWLVLVTYMQHHHEHSITYDDSDYHFAEAAVQTVDRKFGWGVDTLTHHITDGHVAHHLFFTKIPHYNLAKATKALRPYLESIGVYQFQENPFFLRDYVLMNYHFNLSHHSKNGVEIVDNTKKTH